MILELHTKETFKGLFKTEFEFSKEEDLKKVDEFVDKDIHALDWLVENDKLDLLEKILVKRLLTSITGDLLSFLYEGLNCSMRGKTNVAYANFRKPLKDNLTLLEMILIDPTEFTRKYFIDGDPNNYDPSSRNLNKEELIEKTLEKLENKKLLDKGIIHTLRFDKTNSNGFDPLSNLALHIVTGDRNYKTEDKNLNFIFSSKEDIERQWEHIYFFLPYLLVYTLCVVDEILFSVLEGKEDIKSYRAFKIMLKMLYWMTEHEKFNGLEKLIKNIGKGEKCDSCGEDLELGIHDLKLHFDTDLLPCAKCLSSLIKFPEDYRPEFFDMEFNEEDFKKE